jgi:hypothetical protein
MSEVVEVLRRAVQTELASVDKAPIAGNGKKVNVAPPSRR